MPTTKAYERVKNTNSVSDNFLKTPYWTPEVEDVYQNWLKQPGRESPPELIDEYLLASISVSFKLIDASVCCTLSNLLLKDQDRPHLVTGWSDNWAEALMVVHYKISEQLGGNWVSYDQGRKSPRR